MNHDYKHVLNHLIKQQEGKILYWTSKEFLYQGLNSTTAQLLGFGTPEEFIGRSDYEIKCEAVNLADQFRAEDAWVLETGKTFKAVKILKMSGNKNIVFHSVKTPLYDSNQELFGVYHEGIILPGNSFAKALNFVAKNSSKNLGKIIVSNTIFAQNTQATMLPLTEKQQECMFVFCHVKSAKSIASILEISPRTVEKHLSDIKNKMNCLNETQLFDKCFTEGFSFRVPESLIECGGVIINETEEYWSKARPSSDLLASEGIL